MFKAYLFDMDGTLVDTANIIMASFNKALENNGVKRLSSRDFYDKMFGVPPQRIGEVLDIDKTKTKSILLDFMGQWTKQLPEVKVFESADSTLKKLKKSGKKLGVVSASPNEIIEKTLASTNLLGYFGAIVGSDDVTRHKPHHDPVTLALKRLKASPSETLFIGDTKFDMQAGRDAGCTTVLFNNGRNKYPNEVNSDYTIERISEILEI